MASSSAPTPRKSKAYSYIRMSTDIQLKGDSLRRQKELSENYTRQNSLELVENLEDIGISAYSGKNLTEGALGKFIDRLDLGLIESGSYLLIESFDRLSRDSVLNAFSQFTNILNKGITIVTLTDNQVYTKETVTNNVGQLYTSIGVMLRANDESRTKSERLKAAWLNKRNNIGQKKYTAICPAWLKLNKTTGEFEYVDQMVNAVKEIFKRSIAGDGSFAISRYLNANLDKFPSKDLKKGWHKSYIQKILNNPSVYGEYTPHKMVDGKRVSSDRVQENYFPAIITKADFDLSQAKQKQRAINGAGRKGELFSNMFTGLIKCGCCNSTVAFRNKGELPKGGKYLRCGNAERGLKCAAPSWKYDEFEAEFLQYISELDIGIIFNGDEAALKKDVLANQITALEHNLFQNVERLAKNIDLMLDSSPELAAKLKQKSEELIVTNNATEESINALRQELALLDDTDNSTRIKNSIDEYYQLIDGKSDSEIRDSRQKIYNELKRLISRINFYNFEKYVVFDEELNNVNLQKELINKGYKTEKQQIDYLLSEAGQRFFNQHTRSFVVIFRNGSKRIVKPSENFNAKLNAVNFVDHKNVVQSDTLNGQ